MSRRLPELPPIGWLALACVLAMAAVIAAQAVQLVPLVFAKSAPVLKAVVRDGSATFDAALARDAQRIDNRSPFFVPPRPTPKVVERPKSEPKPIEKPKDEAPPPARYGGPGIIAMLGDSVWLETGSRVRVDEEADGVRVVSTQAPWSARVQWRGKEYDVTLFERTTAEFLAGGQAASGDEASAADPEPSAEDDDQVQEQDEPADDEAEDGDDGES